MNTHPFCMEWRVDLSMLLFEQTPNARENIILYGHIYKKCGNPHYLLVAFDS